MKKFFCLFLITVLFAGILLQSPARAAYDIKESDVYVNGEYVTTVALDVLNGRAFAPLSLFREFGFAISWDSKNQMAMIEDTVLPGDEQFSFNHYWWAIMVDNYTLIENNPSDPDLTIAYMDELGYPNPPIMGGDGIYVPLRLFVQIMGGDVDYSRGDINFNLPQSVINDINYRTENTTAASMDCEMNPDIVNLFY